jgi:hypothetical protein
MATPTAASGATIVPEHRAPIVGSIGLRLVDVPAIARDDPRAQLYIVDHLPPGTTIQRRIEVSNTTASDTRVVLYASAATIGRGGFIGAAGRTPNDLSSWTAVRPGTADVPANSSVTTDVTISVPRDAARGEQYAVVWAEVRSTPATDGGLTQVSRVGIRLYISTGTGGPQASDFAIASLTAHRSTTGQPLIVATVRNTGGRALDMNGFLQLSDGPGGLSAGPFRAALGTTLAIGDTEPVTIALDPRIPAGPWRARVTLRSGLLERSVQATVTFPNAGASPVVAITTGRRGWSQPAVVGVVVLMGLGIASLLLRSDLMRRRRLKMVAGVDEGARGVSRGLSRASRGRVGRT